jgi:exonuclease SbcC
LIIKKVALKNIKSYGEDVIEFEEGITSIHGLNGAGKSTVLESIGYALFDSLPYNQSDFVRKGEKTGEVTVTILGHDGIEYIITRKCGSSLSYSIKDQNGILIETKEDVGPKLCEILGYKVPDIGQLRSLFENAVGVLQGTFVSEFLENPSRRKAIFDPLLRIDEYNMAHKNLLLLKNLVKDGIDSMDKELRFLEGKTERLEPLKMERDGLVQHKTMLLGDEKSKKELLQKVVEQRGSYDDIESVIRDMESKQKVFQADIKNKKAGVDRIRAELEKSKDAKKKLELSEAGYKQYQEKASEKEVLEKHRLERDALLKQVNEINSDVKVTRSKLSECERSLKEMEQYEADIKSLEPIAAEQEKLEAESQGIASDLNARDYELIQLKERMKPLKGAGGNICPLMPAVECKSVTDFRDYFNNELSKLNEYKTKLEARRKEIAGKLRELNDPKLALNVKRESLKKKSKIKIEQEDLLDSLCGREDEQRELLSSLGVYAALEGRFNSVNDELRSLKPHYDEYQLNIKIASLAEERQRELDEATRALENKVSGLSEVERALADRKSAYDAEAHAAAKSTCNKLTTELASIGAKLEAATARLKAIEGELSAIDECIMSMASLKEKRSVELGYLSFVEHAREVIRMAGPEVVRVYIELISREATEMYCEIAGDRRFGIRWTPDYDIVLMEDGRERTFRQLSGGEQMSAALAVRLAVLKILTSSDVVFLDEPTQNLDESRRERLAEEIMRIKDFRQMVIISHDDTFNASLENVIEIEKLNGESKVRRRSVHAGPQATLP